MDFYLMDGDSAPVFVDGSAVEASLSSEPLFLVCSKDNPLALPYLKVSGRTTPGPSLS